MTDRRTRFATSRVVARELGEAVPGAEVVDPWPARVAVRSIFLHAAPGGPRDRELLFGDHVDVIDERDGWSFGRSAKDGYCGWMRTTDLGPDFVPTHAVQVRHTHVYPAAELRCPPSMRLPFGASVTVERVEGRWARTPAGWIRGEHLREIGVPMRDPVAVAALFLGTPYLWAGNSGDGIDCSGLVQVSCLACGTPCPGDSDLQEAALGVRLPPEAELRRGDLLFWKGHVAWIWEPGTILHANAHAMAVSLEPLDGALRRIEAQGEGGLTSRRRIGGVHA